MPHLLVSFAPTSHPGSYASRQRTSTPPDAAMASRTMCSVRERPNLHKPGPLDAPCLVLASSDSFLRKISSRLVQPSHAVSRPPAARLSLPSAHRACRVGSTPAFPSGIPPARINLTHLLRLSSWWLTPSLSYATRCRGTSMADLRATIKDLIGLGTRADPILVPVSPPRPPVFRNIEQGGDWHLPLCRPLDRIAAFLETYSRHTVLIHAGFIASNEIRFTGSSLRIRFHKQWRHHKRARSRRTVTSTPALPSYRSPAKPNDRKKGSGNRSHCTSPSLRVSSNHLGIIACNWLRSYRRQSSHRAGTALIMHVVYRLRLCQRIQGPSKHWPLQHSCLIQVRDDNMISRL
ncbi:hypothetical protein L226DRAFT_243910 [Lentinus tigrinus ALCF2SS1-7]|uniref:Uncharacterized protein n=1 Tax=Lentinus tigrinus ALCF2SS1-6 TaxID=1328759 RepID=A0A5C2SP44_9APHY|nr:hypothetical protein L227DRAFT_210021 [Lentinus tigrinus ALCF2SS1-6]RPD79203.1 hypothetical protein L226DRAFT_243910 [Lentinus tigrinus ALCF2SS1-7]